MTNSSVNFLAIAAAEAFATPFNGIVRLQPDGDAALWIDGRKEPPSVSPKPPGDVDDAPTCVWRASNETLKRILQGERFVSGAYISGRLSISGDMSIMAQVRLEHGPRG